MAMFQMGDPKPDAPYTQVLKKSPKIFRSSGQQFTSGGK
jgi:hypothetical protein